MKKNELKTQNEIWDKFLAKYNLNYFYVILDTKEREELVNILGITKNSSDRLKRKASELPVTRVKIGKDGNTPTFYAHFFMGRNALGELITYQKEDNESCYRNGFETPDAAYDYILCKASECNASISKNNSIIGNININKCIKK